MITGWLGCKSILCIRADNMGDLLMSSPAIRALKQTFACKVTVLTSSMAQGIAGHIPEIDEVMVYNFPWVKTNTSIESEHFLQAVKDLRERRFDAAVIFTVFSQNPLPAVMLAYLAGIPLRLAYCRENPYDLLTHWVPDKEPYSYVRHQVKRDLELVGYIGAATKDVGLSVRVPATSWVAVSAKLINAGVDMNRPWLIIHAGVSEKKREYPEDLWMEAGTKIIDELKYQVILTGTKNEKLITDSLQKGMGQDSFSMAGAFSLEEFISLVENAPLVISVNTGTIHIAAATSTPVIVMYALTNPQHLPWKVPGKVLLFDVPEALRSRNEVLRFVHDHLLYPAGNDATPGNILLAAAALLSEGGYKPEMPELIPLRNITGQ